MENPVDKPVSDEQSFPPHAPPFKDKDLYSTSELIDSLIAATEILSARLDAIDLHLQSLIGALDADDPLQALIGRLKAMRKGTR